MYYARKAEPRSSKLLYERELASRLKRHRDRLRRMKPSVDNKAPKRFIHLERNLKKEQMQEGERDEGHGGSGGRSNGAVSIRLRRPRTVEKARASPAGAPSPAGRCDDEV